MNKKIQKYTIKRENGVNILIGLFEQTQTNVQLHTARSVDIALVVRNWLFGWYIVEFENAAAGRSDLYGKRLIETLSSRLDRLGMRGMSPTNLRIFRNFYLTYSEILQTLSAESPAFSEFQKIQQTVSVISSASELKNKEGNQTLPTRSISETLNIHEIIRVLSNSFKLSWSHYVLLLTIDFQDERRFYEIESIENSWSIRELKRQVNSSLYERLALSRNKEKVKELAQKGQLVSRPSDILKSPYILEFLGLQEKPEYTEQDLETAIINKIESFLLELGKGFLFEARQKRFTFNDKHFYVDLVFYNRLLRCYVIIDLKLGTVKHQDIGQMQMYVHYFDRYIKTPEENPTIGILLCHNKDDEMVELTLPKNANIYASEYKLYLPDKEVLKKKIKEAHDEWEAINGNAWQQNRADSDSVRE